MSFMQADVDLEDGLSEIEKDSAFSAVIGLLVVEHQPSKRDRTSRWSRRTRCGD
jgi:hypothetical protein